MSCLATALTAARGANQRRQVDRPALNRSHILRRGVGHAEPPGAIDRAAALAVEKGQGLLRPEGSGKRSRAGPDQRAGRVIENRADAATGAVVVAAGAIARGKGDGGVIRPEERDGQIAVIRVGQIKTHSYFGNRGGDARDVEHRVRG